jgi:hypothetical protein
MDIAGQGKTQYADGQVTDATKASETVRQDAYRYLDPQGQD